MSVVSVIFDVLVMFVYIDLLKNIWLNDMLYRLLMWCLLCYVLMLCVLLEW